MNYQNRFILDKAYFSECYQETFKAKPFYKTYAKAFVLFILANVLFNLPQQNTYIPWFVFFLSVVEVLSCYFHQSWWLFRQMLSKEAKSTVELTITEQAITTQSYYRTNVLLFDDLTDIEKTSCGWILSSKLSSKQGRQYLSSSHLSEQVEKHLERYRAKLSGHTS